MTVLDDHWRDGLEAEALTIDIAPDDGTVRQRVMRRGRRRRHRNQLVVATASAALLVASGLAWQANRHDGGGRPAELRIADEGESVAPLPGVESTPSAGDGPGYAVDPATLPPVSLAASPLQWSTRSVPYGKGLSGAFFGPPTPGPGGLVTVSTKPGVNRGGEPSADELAFYTSTDGVSWKEGGTQTGRHWFGDIMTTAQGLVAVGTAAATGPIERATGEFGFGGTGDAVVATSTDGGRNWRDIVLPLDLRALAKKAAAGGAKMTIQVSGAKLVQGRAGLVALVGVAAEPGERDFFTRVAPGSGGITFGADGVTTYRMTSSSAREIERVVPWSELGVDPEIGALAGGRVHVFRSIDGETFSELGSFGGGSVERLVVTAAGYAAVVVVNRAAGTWAVMTSADGSSWSATDPLPFDAQSGVSSAGVVDGRLVVTGSYKGWPAVAAAEDGRWRLTSLANGIAAAGDQLIVGQAVAGPGGVAFALTLASDPVAGITLHESGITLRVDGMARGVAVIDDATGAELARFSDPLSIASGGVLRVTSTGSRVGQITDNTLPGAPLPTLPPGATTTSMPGPGAVYVVLKGDTASGIAGKLGLSLEALTELFPGVDLSALHAGDRLSLPPTARQTPYDVIGGTLEVLDPATGAVRATFDLGAFRSQYQQATNGSGRSNLRTVLLHSVDLAAWSLRDITADVGTAGPFVSMLVSTEAGIVVTVMTDETDPDAPDPGAYAPGPIRRQKAFVGTR